MASTRFELVTHWTLASPPVAVWAALMAPEEWPTWWRAVKQVDVLAPGDTTGIGTYRRFTWRTALPYAIAINMRTTLIEPLSVIEG